MVPARGELEISNNNKFKYNLASHPNAAVHVGWLFATAFLSADIIPRIEELYSQQNVKDFIILGHSQGGAIAFLLTAHLYSLQKSGALPLDIRFKTYCSAAPKPGNLFFAYEYEALTQNGWAYNVVSSADWVPQTPISIQTLSDFNPTNPFINAKSAIKEQKFPARIVFKKVYKNLDKPTRKAQKNYEKYLGKMAGKIIKNSFEEYKAPQYYSSNDYVRTGLTIVLHSDEEYFKIYPDSNEDIFIHHLHAPYLYLLDKLKMD
jgi:hypothetical protein